MKICGNRIILKLPSTGIQSIIIIVLLVIFLLHNFYNNNNNKNTTINKMKLPIDDANNAATITTIITDNIDKEILSKLPLKYHKYLINQNKILSENHKDKDLTNNIQYINGIKNMIGNYNEKQMILNDKLFEKPLENDSVIIVVQVHTRILYLRYLIVSLAQAKDISKVLLIFSHDYYDEEINELIKSIDFCRVMQIFYPHSIQTHPDEFPGEHKNDCPRDMNRVGAMAKNCNNAMDPDVYGHYREAIYTQTKHHWWWKANRVFDQLDVTRNHSGLVLFLEEDHYVAKDFLYMIKLIQSKSYETCPKCNVIALGKYQFDMNSFNKFNMIEIAPWQSTKHNMGFSFNRTIWNTIVKCRETFCSYDDYNWDWSLQYISQNCIDNQLYSIAVKEPRVFHIGECGVHHQTENCNPKKIISNVLHLLKKANKSGQMFPNDLIEPTVNLIMFTSKRNGGWSDKRDHMLCMNMTIV